MTRRSSPACGFTHRRTMTHEDQPEPSRPAGDRQRGTCSAPALRMRRDTAARHADWARCRALDLDRPLRRLRSPIRPRDAASCRACSGGPTPLRRASRPQAEGQGAGGCIGMRRRQDGCATDLRHWRNTGAEARRPVAGEGCASAPLARPMPSCPLGGMGQWRSGATWTGWAAAQDGRAFSKHRAPSSGAAVAQIGTEARA